MVEFTREFICLAGCLSFSKAAKMLNVSQPSLSRHIADLESQLGFKLFDRNPLSLTPAGRYYLESMSDVIGRIDAVVERGRAIAAGEGGSLVVCMVPFDIGVYSNVVYEAIAQTRERLPGFSVQFYTSRTRTVFDAVVSGKADVGVLFDMPEDSLGATSAPSSWNIPAWCGHAGTTRRFGCNRPGWRTSRTAGSSTRATGCSARGTTPRLP